MAKRNAETATAFWRKKSLAQMTPEEWESLCDGCGRCCLCKFFDAESGAITYTRVACRLLDTESGSCSDYPNRTQQVADCVVLTATTVADYSWLPRSCAYRQLSEGSDLEWWHPLLSGDPETVREAGISAAGRVISEAYVHPDEIEEQTVEWIN
ncbi:MAG: YcgN family cysteine cluster protein [Gammaproteobacteria bacterium]|nr:YcgN family cysteine cluster protein [Gammaproteobacteria bacterium]